MGCAPSGSPAERYAEAARLGPTDPAAAGRLCRSLDLPLADECRTLTAHAAAAAFPERAEALCEAVESPFWRGECWFLVAEELVPVLGGASAATRCAHAGSFRGNCLDHVWRAHASSLLADAPFPDALQAYAPARAWADGLLSQPDTAITQRFWQPFYDAPLHDPALPLLDLANCDTVGDHAVDCQRRLPAAFRHTLSRLARERAVQGVPVDLALACSASAGLPARTEAAFGVRYAPSPPLDALAARALAAQCGGPAQ